MNRVLSSEHCFPVIDPFWVLFFALLTTSPPVVHFLINRIVPHKKISENSMGKFGFFVCSYNNFMFKSKKVICTGSGFLQYATLGRLTILALKLQKCVSFYTHPPPK